MASTLHHPLIRENTSDDDMNHSSPITVHLKSPTEQVSDIEHLLGEILLRLPALTLVSLKPVCTKWNILISSPQFRRAHTFLHHNRQSNSSTATAGIFLRCSASPTYAYKFLSLPSTNLNTVSISPPLQIPVPRGTIKILQSCNGLLLCCSLLKPTDLPVYNLHSQSRNPRDYFIYNPTTTEFKPLPPIRSSNILGVTLAFDLSKSLDHHYRVVCVGFTSDSSYEYWIDVYDSYTNSWTPWVGNNFVAHHQTAFHKGVYWNNAVHWINLQGNDDSDSLYFDTHALKLCKMASPPPQSSMAVGRVRGHHEVCVANGCLHYLHSSGYGLGNRRVVFVMESYEGGWLPKYSFDVDGLLAKCVMLCFGAMKGGEEKDEGRTSLVVHEPGQILAYDLRDGSCRQVLALEGRDRLQFRWFDACPYTPSLACI